MTEEDNLGLPARRGTKMCPNLLNTKNRDFAICLLSSIAKSFCTPGGYSHIDGYRVLSVLTDKMRGASPECTEWQCQVFSGYYPNIGFWEPVYR